MNEFNLIKIDGGRISEVAGKFIDKVSDAVGVIAKPYQIKRVAEAEAQAAVIQANARVQISEIERRGLERLIREEGQKQENIENITYRAIPHLKSDARPEDVDKDWISHFFDRCRLVSDEQMQELWASILANETNTPHRFSKKTIDTVAALEKSDAEMFSNLCSFVWLSDGPLVFVMDSKHNIYHSKNITFDNLEHLESIGLINFGTVGNYTTSSDFESVTLSYCGRQINLTLQNKIKWNLGRVRLTRTGGELFYVCSAIGSEEFMDYMINYWINTVSHVSVSVDNRLEWTKPDWNVRPT